LLTYLFVVLLTKLPRKICPGQQNLKAVVNARHYLRRNWKTGSRLSKMVSTCGSMHHLPGSKF